MTTFKVIVVGGGLAGLLLANGLIRHDIDFTLYEADPEVSERDGFQIRLGAPAVAGFKKCLDGAQQAELLSKFGRSGGVLSSAPIVYDSNFRMVLDLTKFPAYTKSAPITRVALRDFLSDPLKRTRKIRYEKRFLHYECIRDASDKTKVKVFFEDGSQDTCDLLISAEGANSRINRQVGMNNIIPLPSHWNLSAKCALPAERLLGLPAECHRSAVGVAMDGLFLHFSAYIPHGFNYKDSDSKNHLLNRAENDVGSVFWSLIIPEERVPQEVVDGTKNRLDFCCEQLKNWNPVYEKMLRTIGEETILVFKHHTSKQPSSNWRQIVKTTSNVNMGNEHIWLLGDAVHAMTPARGMGGNQAMCDTADLLPRIVELAEKAKSGSEVTDQDFSIGVDVYEKAMFHRAFEWVQKSGGHDQGGVDVSTIRGKIGIFLISRALDLAYLWGVVKGMFGYLPVDDAPEFQ